MPLSVLPALYRNANAHGISFSFLSLEKITWRWEDLLRLMVSEYWVHGALASLFWASHKADHHGRRFPQSKPAYLMVARKQGGKEREGHWGKGIVPKGMPPVTYFFHLGPTTYHFSPSHQMLSNMNLSILFHWWGQNPYDPISSPKVHLETLLPRGKYMPLWDISDLNHHIWSLHGRPVISLVIDGHCGDQEHSLPVQRHFTCVFVQNPC